MPYLIMDDHNESFTSTLSLTWVLRLTDISNYPMVVRPGIPPGNPAKYRIF